MSVPNDFDIDSLLAQLLAGSGRPATPETMLGLTCQLNPDDLLAVGDYQSATGFDADGNFTLTMSTPREPLGAIKLSRDQVVQLRDFLTSKLV